eukprot:3634983-Amphidinium_carterae.1
MLTGSPQQQSPMEHAHVLHQDNDVEKQCAPWPEKATRPGEKVPGFCGHGHPASCTAGRYQGPTA